MTEFTHEAHAFWLEVARSLDVWQRAEQELCEIFVATVQAPISDTVRAAFYKVVSVGTKRQMITAALAVRVEDEALTARWKRLSNDVELLSKERNALAHGTRWETGGRSIMGPHFSDVTLRDRHMRLNDNDFLDAVKIHALQGKFWALVSALEQFNRDLRAHTMSLGKPINLPKGRI